MDAKQQKELDALVTQLQKDFGKEAISMFGKNRTLVKWAHVNSFYLTELMGRGYPRGRMIEIYGPESAGKSSLACYLGGECQKNYFEDKGRYGVVAYIDAEHAIDPAYAATFGLKFEEVLFSQPDSGEQALDLVEALLKSGLVDMIIIDSVAALTPQAEIDGEMGDQQMALQARLMSKACRKLQSLQKEDSATIVWINQIRMKMVMMGNPETTAGGLALRFFSTIRLVTRRGEAIMGKGEEQIGMECNIKTIKNKVNAPMKTCTMRIIYGKGYQVDEEFVMAFSKYDIIDRGGAGWYTVTREGKPLKIQGTPAMIQYMLDNPAYYQECKQKLFELMQKESQKVTEAAAIEAPENDEAIEAEAAAQVSLEKEALADTSPAALAALAAPAPAEEKPVEKKPAEKKPSGIKKGEMVDVTEEDLKAR